MKALKRILLSVIVAILQLSLILFILSVFAEWTITLIWSGLICFFSFWLFWEIADPYNAPDPGHREVEK